MVKITTLMDNHPLPNTRLSCEHGFSCFIEVGSLRMLFDTGKSEAFLRNSETLHVDLSKLDDVIISHAHYDHGGGVLSLLKTHSFQGLSMWTGRGFETPKYADESDTLRYLGVDFDAKTINHFGVMWHTVCDDTIMIHPGVWLVSGFSHLQPLEKPNPRFVIDQGQGRMIDDFKDEISLVIDSPKGLILIVGCSHPGILNMLDSVQARFSRPLYALIGGIHLYDASPERREMVVHELIQRNIPKLGVSHCTGDEAAEELEKSCTGFFRNRAGTVTIID
jgi:7,8-dihydropterin-6-yl-methyl-4-(beta-D-ribofuranosyl)aminobenzene 5'-phosphate synthase